MPFGLSVNDIVLYVVAGVLGLIGVTITWVLVRGLFNARSLFRRELTAYFLSPIAYVVFVLLLLVTGLFFRLTLGQLTARGEAGVEYPLQFMLDNPWFWLVFLFIPPLLTMRLFAEERGSGTLEMLLTAPLRDWQIVLTKYLACLIFFLLLWVPTLAYLPVLLDLHVEGWKPVWTPFSLLLLGGLGGTLLGLLLLLPRLGTGGRIFSLLLLAAGLVCTAVGGWGHFTRDPEHLVTIRAGIDPMPVLSAYLGLALAGAMFLALGLFVSSLVRSQMVAALLALVMSLVFVAAGFWRTDLDTSSPFGQLLFFFSVPLHFQRDFARGLIDTRHLVLYGSVALFFLFLTVRSLESRRWRA